ncbi:MAG: aldose 1-epimerase family protein [Streptosporangiaceae bacterium]
MVSLWGRQWSREDLLARVGRLEQIAGVQLLEATDGAERGVRVLRFATGAGLDFEVLVDRGFDIGRAWTAGRPIAWWSPVGLISPWLHDPSGIEWFRGFPGGLVSTCGLDHTLLGGADDTSFFNYPHRRTQDYGLHGRYTGLPARLAGYGCTWHGDECQIWAQGEVVQAAVFGEQLTLSRRIEADLGGASLRIRDTVTNIGVTQCPHMMLYHCNVGFPVVDAGAELVYPAAPGRCVSEARSEDYRRLEAPAAEFVEECYEHDMQADEDGYVAAAVVNRSAGLGVYQRYRRAELPHHITWRQLGRGTYVVAMEPSTNRDAGRFDARERGELQLLEPGETRRYDLELGVLSGAAAIDKFAAGTAQRILSTARGPA